MPCKSPHGMSKGVGLPSPAISGGSKVSQKPDLVFLMCSQTSKMLPDDAKVYPRFHQDCCKSFGDVHRCSKTGFGPKYFPKSIYRWGGSAHFPKMKRLGGVTRSDFPISNASKDWRKATSCLTCLWGHLEWQQRWFMEMAWKGRGTDVDTYIAK